MNILNHIIAYKKEEVAVRKLLVPEEELAQSILFKRKCLSLKSNLLKGKDSGIIAEFKRRSPSKGYINENADIKKVTASYTKYGASALSVLTDNHFFGGSSEDLILARANKIPILTLFRENGYFQRLLFRLFRAFDQLDKSIHNRLEISFRLFFLNGTVFVQQFVDISDISFRLLQRHHIQENKYLP